MYNWPFFDLKQIYFLTKTYSYEHENFLTSESCLLTSCGTREHSRSFLYSRAAQSRTPVQGFGNINIFMITRLQFSRKGGALFCLQNIGSIL